MALKEASDRALKTQDKSELEALEDEINAIVAWFIKNKSRADGSVFTLAIRHARYAIAKQKEFSPRAMTQTSRLLAASLRNIIAGPELIAAVGLVPLGAD